MAKARYSEYAFAKGWASVSQITGLPGKEFLYSWYFKNCAHARDEQGKPLPSAYEIVKSSQIIGNLMDVQIQHYFEDETIPEIDSSLIEKAGRWKDEYYQALRNFYSFAKEYKPKSIAGQMVVWSKKYKVIGSLDRLTFIQDQIVLGDWKATNFVSYEYLLQLEGYYHLVMEMMQNGDMKEHYPEVYEILKVDNWHEQQLWLVQFAKKRQMERDDVKKFSTSLEAWEKGFLGLLGYYYQKKETAKELGFK